MLIGKIIKLMKTQNIFLPGGAGLVGQNLIPRLKARGYSNIIVFDKHPKNVVILRSLHPDVEVIEVDLANGGDWQDTFARADMVVMLQAQIGGLFYDEFVANNVKSTRLILEAIRKHAITNVVHISSSVVESVVDDFYTRSKIEQEQVVLESSLSKTTCSCSILLRV